MQHVVEELLIVTACAGLFDHPPWKSQVSFQAKREESEAVMFSCIKDLLHRCKIAPSQVSPTQQLADATVTGDATEASSAGLQCIADAWHHSV